MQIRLYLCCGPFSARTSVPFGNPLLGVPRETSRRHQVGGHALRQIGGGIEFPAGGRGSASSIESMLRALVASPCFVGAIAVALSLLVFSPTVSGAVAFGGTVNAVPYRVQGVYTSVLYSQSGYGNVSAIVSPFFHGNTGAGGFSANASLPSCSGACIGDQEISPAQIGFSIPLGRMLPTNPLTRATNVTVNWSLSWTTHIRYSSGTCQPTKLNSTFSCYWGAFTLLQVMEESIYDKTTGVYYNPSNMGFMNWTGWWGRGGAEWGNDWYNSSYCSTQSNGSLYCKSSQSLPNSTQISQNATQLAFFRLPASTSKQDYVLEFDFLWSVQLSSRAQGASFSGSSSRLALDMAGPARGNSLDLTSITFS
jgi:hypothetical protein